MGFSSVFKSLQEIFPQVDARLLRAVAIEHPKDVDHAVEVVLTEVLPYISKHLNSSSPQEQQCPIDPSGEGRNVGYVEESKCNEDNADANLTGKANNADSTSISSSKVEMNDDVGLDLVANADQHQESVDSERTAVMPMQKSQEVELSEKEAKEALIHMKADYLKKMVVLLRKMTVERSVSGGDNQVFMAEPESSEDANNTDSTSLNTTCNGGVVFDKSISSDKLKMNDDVGMDLVANVNQVVNIECGTEETEDVDATISALENENVTEVPGSDQCPNTQSVVPDPCQDCSDKDESALVSRSGQIYAMESLEGIIEDAKNSKKTLVSEKESIISMMREVEIHEKAAEEAKEEAAKGGDAILLKVEELKKMLVQAKEANDMHAGEVYGEKAILATEVRELQSRLLSLSHERDLSLAILNDMRETLEARLSSAEEVKRAALLEKQEKEANAQSALAEQEAIMEKVVQESKILRQEAEENSKLQEFLMDRGHIVDMLQGEISVICQDVRLLKEKFDNHVPLSIASSSLSLKSVVSDLDIELSSPIMLNKTSPTTPLTNRESPKSVLGEDRPKNNHKALVDDEWYLFDGVGDFVNGIVLN